MTIPWRENSATELLAEACKDAAARLQPRLTAHGNPSAWPLESQLEREVITGLSGFGVPQDHIGARQACISADWDPLPGAIDLYICSHPPRQFWLIAELKLEEIEQSQWDLYKVLAGRKLPGSPSTCLVNAARDATWRRQPPCSELFPDTPGATVEVDSRDLFKRNHVQWSKDLAYAGRPVTVPSSVVARGVAAGVRLAHYPELELRVAEVTALDPTPMPLHNGWPV